MEIYFSTLTIFVSWHVIPESFSCCLQDFLSLKWRWFWQVQLLGLGIIFGLFVGGQCLQKEILCSALTLSLALNCLKVFFSPFLRLVSLCVMTDLLLLWTKEGGLGPSCFVWTWALSSIGPSAHLLKTHFMQSEMDHVWEQDTCAGGSHPHGVHPPQAWFALLPAGWGGRECVPEPPLLRGFTLPELLLSGWVLPPHSGHCLRLRLSQAAPEVVHFLWAQQVSSHSP